jgi:hypothetical protein
MRSATYTNRSLGLLTQVICPHCWERFAPEDVLWIAAHEDLNKDDMLADGAYRRFKPTRFTVSGQAIDARGMACHTLACPHCHLEVPEPVLQLEPLFLSISVPPPAASRMPCPQ